MEGFVVIVVIVVGAIVLYKMVGGGGGSESADTLKMKELSRRGATCESCTQRASAATSYRAREQAAELCRAASTMIKIYGVCYRYEGPLWGTDGKIETKPELLGKEEIFGSWECQGVKGYYVFLPNGIVVSDTIPENLGSPTKGTYHIDEGNVIDMYFGIFNSTVMYKLEGRSLTLIMPSGAQVVTKKVS